MSRMDYNTTSGKSEKMILAFAIKKNVPLPKYFYNDKETFICIQDEKGGESLPLRAHVVGRYPFS